MLAVSLSSRVRRQQDKAFSTPVRPDAIYSSTALVHPHLCVEGSLSLTLTDYESAVLASSHPTLPDPSPPPAVASQPNEITSSSGCRPSCRPYSRHVGVSEAEEGMRPARMVKGGRERGERKDASSEPTKTHRPSAAGEIKKGETRSHLNKTSPSLPRVAAFEAASQPLRSIVRAIALN